MLPRKGENVEVKIFSKRSKARKFYHRKTESESNNQNERDSTIQARDPRTRVYRSKDRVMWSGPSDRTRKFMKSEDRIAPGPIKIAPIRIEWWPTTGGWTKRCVDP